MTTEDFNILSVFAIIITLFIIGVTINNKLSERLKNDERIIARLDMLINNKEKDAKIKNHEDQES
ncbi:hypothetical protein [Cohnella yongneupensis]|uniref:Uncharacterized protein n=1 Tax=Cohnella yongneupensis TaxID=425006 RepID=A0ABW0QSV6_9BACL